MQKSIHICSERRGCRRGGSGGGRLVVVVHIYRKRCKILRCAVIISVLRRS
ncbi:hypothetical protein K439DRAFT_683385 [Ramaria rubella]|nr:hypothetical protein K439DRAFT_683385 [Ramaria rubella]